MTVSTESIEGNAVRKTLPFARELWEAVAEEYGTPIYVYNEAGIRANAQRLLRAFSWADGYKNFFAVKATPTPAILRIVADEGMGFDCSSRGELVLVQRESLVGSSLFFSSNNTPDSDYQLANELGATINLDKAPYVGQVRHALDEPPAAMAIRYNPGEIGVGNAIIGFPRHAKFGMVCEDAITAIKRMREWGVRAVGLHAMVVSNEREAERFAATARVLRELAEKICAETGKDVDFINIGGGIGVTYHPSDGNVDVEAIGEAVHAELGDFGVPVVSENGRYVTGPHGYLLTRITHGIQQAHEPFLQVDTSINNIARLATVTAAYHQLDVLGREEDRLIPMNVTGSMCANTDIMFRSSYPDGRPGCELPETSAPGDLLVIHDAGAHCRANSHNYNFRLRCGEVLVRADGTHALIRRHETIDDLLQSTDGL